MQTETVTDSQATLNYSEDPDQNKKEGMNTTQAILGYLQNCLPGYPFDPVLDADYVQELVVDFPDINILAEIKAFRWYYNNKPFPKSKQPRVALRRWLQNAWPT